MKKSAAKPATKPSGPTLKPGWMVAVVLKPGTAPRRCYAGEIQAIDAQGLRLTLFDWVAGMATGWDFFVPYMSLESAFVATDQHDLRRFGEAVGKWQEAMDPEREKPPQEPQPHHG
jgi:hypothetical protein